MHGGSLPFYFSQLSSKSSNKGCTNISNRLGNKEKKRLKKVYEKKPAKTLPSSHFHEGKKVLMKITIVKFFFSRMRIKAARPTMPNAYYVHALTTFLSYFLYYEKCARYLSDDETKAKETTY